MANITLLFNPNNVLLVGSSKIQEQIGMTSPQLFESVLYNMRKYYEGTTYTIDTGDARGIRAYEDIPNTPDLAVIMLPPNASILQSERCAAIGVKVLVIIAGGYKPDQRKALAKLKEEYGIRILGPNTIMGVINTTNGLNTTFERDVMPIKGGISVISQSGGVGACLLDWACSYGIGIAKFAFMGDKVDVNDIDLLRYFRDDADTQTICLYMEGVEDGRSFMEAAQEVVRKKPILALKGGVTAEAARRVLSHTASIAGSDTIFNAAFRKAGIIRAIDEEELLNMAIALVQQPPLSGDNIAIVSNVGGPAILAADAVIRNQLRLAKLSEVTIQKIERRCPGVDVVNPIDLIADARAERYSIVLDAVLSDPSVDGLMVINMLKSCFFEPEDAIAIAEVAKQHPDKPIVDVPAGGEDFMRILEVLRSTGIPTYNTPEKAARALGALRQHSKIHERLKSQR